MARLSRTQDELTATQAEHDRLVRLIDTPREYRVLAPLVVRRIFEVIRHITTDLRVSVLLVDQNVRAALEMADRAYLVQSGRIVGCGTGQDLLGDVQVQSAYLGLPAGAG